MSDVQVEHGKKKEFTVKEALTDDVILLMGMYCPVIFLD